MTPLEVLPQLSDVEDVDLRTSTGGRNQETDRNVCRVGHSSANETDANVWNLFLEMRFGPRDLAISDSG